MSRKSYIVLSVIFFVLTILFVIAGVFLFNYVPDGSEIGYNDPKHSLALVGCFFSFLFAISCLVGSILALINGMNEKF